MWKIMRHYGKQIGNLSNVSVIRETYWCIVHGTPRCAFSEGFDMETTFCRGVFCPLYTHCAMRETEKVSRDLRRVKSHTLCFTWSARRFWLCKMNWLVMPQPRIDVSKSYRPSNNSFQPLTHSSHNRVSTSAQQNLQNFVRHTQLNRTSVIQYVVVYIFFFSAVRRFDESLHIVCDTLPRYTSEARTLYVFCTTTTVCSLCQTVDTAVALFSKYNRLNMIFMTDIVIFVKQQLFNEWKQRP